MVLATTVWPAFPEEICLTMKGEMQQYDWVEIVKEFECKHAAYLEEDSYFIPL